MGFSSGGFGETQSNESIAVLEVGVVRDGAVVLRERAEVFLLDLVKRRNTRGKKGEQTEMRRSREGRARIGLTFNSDTQFLSMIPFPKNSFTSSPSVAYRNAV